MYSAITLSKRQGLTVASLSQRIFSICSTHLAASIGNRALYSSISPNNISSKKPSTNKSSNTLNSLKRILDEEINHEKQEMEPSDPEVEKNIKNFLDKNEWKLDSQDGNAIITLTSQKDNLQVNILLDIRQIYADESRFEDEEYESSENARNETEENESEEYGNEFEETPFSVKVELIKPSDASRVTMEVMLFEDALEVNSLHFSTQSSPLNFNTDEYLTPKSNVSQFTTPSYYHLSEEVHEAVENYLQSIGLNKDMYSFFSEYVYKKEATEYGLWLNNVRKFFN